MRVFSSCDSFLFFCCKWWSFQKSFYFSFDSHTHDTHFIRWLSPSCFLTHLLHIRFVFFFLLFREKILWEYIGNNAWHVIPMVIVSCIALFFYILSPSERKQKYTRRKKWNLISHPIFKTLAALLLVQSIKINDFKGILWIQCDIRCERPPTQGASLYKST